jgi:glyoxylase-like metal-dependent hydrolase (beta-lactamase superfamily II)
MRVRHLNCTTIHTNTPYPGVTHCLLVETEDGLMLVDTGLGIPDYAKPTLRVRLFTIVNRIPCDPEGTMVRQLARPGYVPHIVLTHLHLDHAGGIVDFPGALVHVYEAEYEAAKKRRRRSWIDRVGYVAQHLEQGTKWVIHRLGGSEWFGLDCVQVLEGSGYEVRLVPLVGHSPGHCGVAVRVIDRWWLHCGDAYVREMQIHPDEPQCPFPGWAALIARRLFPEEPLQQLRALRRAHGGEVEMFCSHDAAVYARLRGVTRDEAVGLRSGAGKSSA